MIEQIVAGVLGKQQFEQKDQMMFYYFAFVIYPLVYFVVTQISPAIVILGPFVTVLYIFDKKAFVKGDNGMNS